VKRNHGIELAGLAGRRDSWPVKALLAVGGWLVVSPLVLSTARVTTGVVSVVGGGLAVAVLAGWALLAARRRQGRSGPTAGGGHRRRVDTGERR
jgi:hypothetical protein